MSPKVNPFLLGYSERLEAWKALRQDLQTAPLLDHKLDLTTEFWRQAPMEKRTIDWDNSNSWPTPWEQLRDNSFCPSSHSLAMAATLVLSCPELKDHLRLKLITDRQACVQKIVLKADPWIINHGFFDKQPVQQLQHVETQDVWTWTGKQWQSLRPK